MGRGGRDHPQHGGRVVHVHTTQLVAQRPGLTVLLLRASIRGVGLGGEGGGQRRVRRAVERS